MNDGPTMNGKTLRMRPSNTPNPDPNCAEFAKACQRFLENRGLTPKTSNTWFKRRKQQ